MDYEKEYKAMMQRARELYESGNALTKLQMGIVCPELAESKDEKIRKGLLRHFKNKTKPYWSGIAVKDIIAYLERQKYEYEVFEPIESTLEYKAGFRAGIESERQKEQNPAEDKDAIEPTPKQDYSGLTDFERAIHRGFLCAGGENVPVGIIKDTAQDCLAQIKPAEWSEEDEENFKWFEKLFRAESVVVGGRDIPQDKYLWFKSLRPQPKVEWSEEDKENLERVDDLLWKLDSYIGDDCSISDQTAEELREEIKNVLSPFLKSLRPSWKPSEEQMEALGDAIGIMRYMREGDTLRELYADLKKL